MKKTQSFKPKKPKGNRQFNGRGFMDRLYSRTWDDFSKSFLGVNGRCYACGYRAECVDHIEPHLGRINYFWKEDNYLPLCHKCHNTVTALYDRYHSPGKPLTKKLWWIGQQRERWAVTSRVKVMSLPADALILLNPF